MGTSVKVKGANRNAKGLELVMTHPCQAPTIYLPLEITEREYLGKLLLAYYFITEGFNVIFGHKAYVSSFAQHYPAPGVYLNKSVGSTNNIDLYNKLRNAGIYVLAQDEEHGGTALNYDSFFKKRKGLSDISILDRFYCWGNHDSSYLREKFPNLREKLVVTGSPRTSFWGDSGRFLLDSEIRTVKSKYNEYVLVASNLVIGNSPLNLEQLTHFRRTFAIDSASSDHELSIRHQNESLLMNEYLKLVKILSLGNKISVVVRPHPTEKIEWWRKVLAKENNVFLDTSTRTSALILGASAVVHNNSTVGLESIAGGIPTYALQGVTDEMNLEFGFPNSISKSLVSADLASIILDEGTQDTRDINHHNLIYDRFQDYGTLLPSINIVKSVKQLSHNPVAVTDRDLSVNFVRRNLLENYAIRSWRMPKLVRQKQKPFSKSQLQRDLSMIQKSLESHLMISVNKVHAFTYRLNKV